MINVPDSGFLRGERVLCAEVPGFLGGGEYSAQRLPGSLGRRSSLCAETPSLLRREGRHIHPGTYTTLVYAGIPPPWYMPPYHAQYGVYIASPAQYGVHILPYIHPKGVRMCGSVPPPKEEWDLCAESSPFSPQNKPLLSPETA